MPYVKIMVSDACMEENQNQEQTPPLLTLEGRSYNLLEVPDSVKVLVDDLMRNCARGR